MLETSGLLDANAYRASAGLNASTDAAKHYLTEGWRAGLPAGLNFESTFLHSYFQSAGFNGPPALTYATLKSFGWTCYRTRKKAEAYAKIIRDSDLFDAAGYAARLGLPDNLDPTLHYILVGEQMGYCPSDQFDPGYYKEIYGSKIKDNKNFLVQYIKHGRAAGRMPVSVASKLRFETSRLDPLLETVMIISHEASRTGAPILAYNIALHLRRHYNVVVLLLSGGELVSEFKECCSAVIGPIRRWKELHPADAKRIVERILASYRIPYAVANTIETRAVLMPLTLALVPVVSLVHEFPSGNKGELGQVLEWATHIVFSKQERRRCRMRRLSPIAKPLDTHLTARTFDLAVETSERDKGKGGAVTQEKLFGLLVPRRRSSCLAAARFTSARAWTSLWPAPLRLPV